MKISVSASKQKQTMQSIKVTCTNEGYQKQPNKVQVGKEYKAIKILSGRDIDVHNGNDQEVFFVLEEFGWKNAFSEKLFK